MTSSKSAQITQDILSEIGFSDLCYKTDSNGNPLLDANGLLQSNNDCNFKLIEVPSVITSTSPNGIKINSTKDISIVNLLNAMIKLVPDVQQYATKTELNDYVKYDDLVRIKIDKDLEVCDSNNVCSYIDSEIVMNDRVPLNTSTILYRNYNNYDKVIFFPLGHPYDPTNDSVTQPVNSDPFVRFMKIIYWQNDDVYKQSSDYSSSTNVNNITSDKYLVYDQNYHYHHTGSCDDINIDGEMFECHIHTQYIF